MATVCSCPCCVCETGWSLKLSSSARNLQTQHPQAAQTRTCSTPPPAGSRLWVGCSQQRGSSRPSTSPRWGGPAALPPQTSSCTPPLAPHDAPPSPGFSGRWAGEGCGSAGSVPGWSSPDRRNTRSCCLLQSGLSSGPAAFSTSALVTLMSASIFSKCCCALSASLQSLSNLRLLWKQWPHTEWVASH